MIHVNADCLAAKKWGENTLKKILIIVALIAVIVAALFLLLPKANKQNVRYHDASRSVSVIVDERG